MYNIKYKFANHIAIVDVQVFEVGESEVLNHDMGEVDRWWKLFGEFSLDLILWYWLGLIEKGSKQG